MYASTTSGLASLALTIGSGSGVTGSMMCGVPLLAMSVCSWFDVPAPVVNANCGPELDGNEGGRRDGLCVAGMRDGDC